MSYIKDLDNKYVASTYARFPVEIVSGKGSLLYNVDGKEYIDVGSGIGVTAFGIADPDWQKAVTEQLSRVQHTSNLYYTEPCAKLAQLLCEKTGMSRVFFGNSGAEANECAIKVARKYAQQKKGSDHYTVITLKNSFHGRTLTTLAATGQEHYHELFQPLTPGFVHADSSKPEELEALIKSTNAAAIMLEIIQGEGGVLNTPKEFIDEAYRIATEQDVVLIIDEVQTGNGRSGEFYAYMNYGIKPDIVTTAKGLGGGLPIGAAILSDKVADVLGHGDHGSTYGGNPVCCAGAYSIISRIDREFLNDVKRKHQLIIDTLKDKKGVLSVSGMGLMIGIETERKAADVVKECIENGVLCLTAKNKVRLLPALNIPDELLIKALNVICDLCAK